MKFRFRMSYLPGLLKMCSFASVLPLCLDCQRSEFLLLPHFRSAFICKDIKLCFRTSHLCMDFQKCEILLPRFHSALITKDLKFCFFHIYALPSIAKLYRYASTLLHCLDYQSFVPSGPLYYHICIFTQFHAVLHEGLALQRDEASLFARKNLNHLVTDYTVSQAQKIFTCFGLSVMCRERGKYIQGH